MRLLKPITITVTENLLTLQKGDTHKVKNRTAYNVFKAMLMHSNSMTFYSASSYMNMCAALLAVAHSNIND